VGIRIFAIVFAAVSLAWVVQRFRRTRRFTIELMAWLVSSQESDWSCLCLELPIALPLAGRLQRVQRLTFIAVTTLLLLVFRILSRLQKVERDLTRLIRAYAVDTAVQVPARPSESTKPSASRRPPATSDRYALSTLSLEGILTTASGLQPATLSHYNLITIR